jgi:hypothetical protein
MVKPTEVRLGNLIEGKFDNKQVEVVSITAQKASDGTFYLINGDLPHHFNPIELTSELFNNFGFAPPPCQSARYFSP